MDVLIVLAVVGGVAWYFWPKISAWLSSKGLSDE